jgi:hypothetical protein
MEGRIDEPIPALFHRFGPPTDSASDLAAGNIPWAATHPAWIFSLREDRDPLTVRVLSLFRVMKSEELKKHCFMGDTALSIERLPAGKPVVNGVFMPVRVSGLSLHDATFLLKLFILKLQYVMLVSFCLFLSRLYVLSPACLGP